jgi:hypothetical protein
MSRYLDSNVINYAVEGETSSPTTKSATELMKRGQFFTSWLTWVEAAGTAHAPGSDRRLAQYKALFQSDFLAVHPASNEVLLKAAEILGQYRLKPADAIHAATAILGECTEFITNDPHFKRVPELNVVLVSDLVSG